MFTHALNEADVSFYDDFLNGWRLEPRTKRGLELMISEGFLPEASCLNTPREITESQARMIGIMAVALTDYVFFAPNFQYKYGL
jgi:hypothetical protein